MKERAYQITKVISFVKQEEKERKRGRDVGCRKHKERCVGKLDPRMEYAQQEMNWPLMQAGKLNNFKYVFLCLKMGVFLDRYSRWPLNREQYGRVFMSWRFITNPCYSWNCRWDGNPELEISGRNATCISNF